MQRILLLILSLSLIIASNQYTGAQEQSKSIVRVKGAYSMAAQMDKLAKDYMQAHPGCNVVVTGGGTPLGFSSITSGEAEIAMASYEIDPDQKRAAESKKIKLNEKLIGWDAVAIIVHPKNPVSDLSIEQLRKIYLNDYLSWDELGGDYFGIILYAQDPARSGLAVFMNNKILEARPTAASIRYTYTTLLRDLANRPDAIGYCPVGALEDSEWSKRIKVLGIRKTPDSPAVPPTKESVANKSYALSKPMLLYYTDSSDPNVKRFVDFTANAISN